MNTIKTTFAISAALIGGGQLAAFDMDDFSIHGFASQGFALSTDNDWLPGSSDGTFEFNEIGLNVGAQLTDKLRVGAQLFSRDFGDLGNNQIELDWAFGDYAYKDWLGIRVGRVKMPMGLYNEYLDLDLARTFAIYPQAVYQPKFRDVQVAINGIELYGNVAIANAGSVDYEIFAGDSRIDASGSVGKEFDGYGLIETQTIDIKYALGGRLIYNTPLDGLRVGGSLVNYDDMRGSGPVIDATLGGMLPFPVPGLQGEIVIDHVYQYVIFGEYQWNDWVFAAEYSRLRGSSIEALVHLPDAFGGTMSVGNDSVDWEGYYLSVTRRLDEHWEVGAYYSEFHEDAQDRDGDNRSSNKHRAWNNTLAVAARYDVNWNWNIKAEIQHHDGTAQLESRFQDPGHEWEDNWQLFLLKTTFNF